MNSAAFDSIIAGIYSGASGRQPWDEALNELARAADVWTMHLVGFDKRTGGVLFSHYGGDATPQTNLDYIRTYHRIDPRTPLALASKDLWFHCHDYFDQKFVDNDPFYQDFLIPYGGRHMSATKIVDDDDMVVALGVHRGRNQRPLDCDTIAWLTRVRSHLVEGMAIYRHLRKLYCVHAVGHQLLDALEETHFAGRRDAGILFKNRAAALALEATDYIVERRGLLGCRHPRDDAALTAAIR